jgi:hypothetical protein
VAAKDPPRRLPPCIPGLTLADADWLAQTELAVAGYGGRCQDESAEAP